ncbi:hypothetical protein CKM354_000943300 [Cercospora kikuchii]|uniref:Glycine zipper 2TM domain-containing protein n=1 Tax=Cercospora kikuchii TaxID=84275 RepID=A0A9P3FK08_9PEZI|nr:uncharacterized protein CKM354_000943300 [Cercospora kikuchii]GIZ46304.1 hypothetical protein CKM354_000943300 [Cercospora kikuchii]
MSSRPDYYNNSSNGGPPPGQGHYNQYPASGYDDRFERGPPPQREHGYVPYQDSTAYSQAGPPPDSYPYDPRDHDAYSSRESFTSGPPRSQYTYGDRDLNRPYAPSEPRPHAGNQMAPYDDNKAEAQYQEWEERSRANYTHGRRPSSVGYGGRRSEDSYDGYYDDRYDDYDDRRRPGRGRRRYSDEETITEKALRYPSDPKKGGRDVLGASEGERGLATNILGGAGGAFLGHKLGRGGAIGTIGGALVGAIAAQAAERQYAKRKEEKVYVKRSVDDPYAVPAGPYPGRGRDMDDVRESGRDVERPSGVRERLRSLSRSVRNRTRSRSRPARSPSIDSDERYHYR